MPAPLIQLRKLNLSFGKNEIFKGLDFELSEGANTAIIGANGAGKSLLAAVLSGQQQIHRQEALYAEGFDPHRDIAFVSFEFQRQLFDIDDYFDDTDFLDFQDLGTPAREAICQGRHKPEAFREVVELLDISYLLERGIRFLSTGEMRKVLIARALLSSPRLLIIDAPFEGLDHKSRSFMRSRLQRLMRQQQCLLLLNEDDQLLDNCDRVHCLHQGNFSASGKAADIRQSPAWKELFPPPAKIIHIPERHPSVEEFEVGKGQELVRLKKVSVHYGEVTALNQLSWTVKEGENWVICGPNGAGKSTLLSLISGDNPQGYNQELHLFGRKRGSGETIWDIRRKIGLITTGLQLNYRQPLNALQVVVSGFFDSIGLYQKADQLQVNIAREWLELLEIKDIHKRYFGELSYGEQRMVLLARAMVKHPRLLILDEPCQGLDSANRQAILNLVDYIALNCDTQILYVSHSHQEDLQCITHRLEFVEDGPHRFRGEISAR
jgi:molybdate transport system ATP-binding protein